MINKIKHHIIWFGTGILLISLVIGIHLSTLFTSSLKNKNKT